MKNLRASCLCFLLLGWRAGCGLDRYSSLGETVTLPCAGFQEYENSFIHWIFNQRSESSELASDGMITVKQPERAARLEVPPDSSLRIHHLHTEDAGQYECQQYLNGMLYKGGTPGFLNLHTITVDPSRDLKRGTALALQCTLVCNGGIADCSSAPDNFELTWVDDEGTALQGDRFKITPNRTHSTLSLELQISDHNRRWRCNLTEGGAVKATYSYTTTLTGASLRPRRLPPGPAQRQAAASPRTYRTPRSARRFVVQHQTEGVGELGQGQLALELVPDALADRGKPIPKNPAGIGVDGIQREESRLESPGPLVYALQIHQKGAIFCKKCQSLKWN
ncbi:uncharacterized protein LOC131709097 [Acipenser ruthenus]|uniref:uncharacterized protein LOC131709097 n=1 Tax=Acipenser ruthenus TaxID=7906 RepID=UPI00145A5EF9|nr:uncharacterized protein LOC131709097 [Acipenser ruthenus]